MLSPYECEHSPNYGGCDNHTDPGDWEWATYMPRIGGKAKCNDVTEQWTCSHEKTEAFRCANDVVEVTSCDGTGACEPVEGKDAVCNVAPPPVAPPADPPADPPPVATSTPDAGGPPKADAAPKAGESSSCAVGSAPVAGSGPFAALAALGIVVGFRRRRR
jgi:MYXO-CTERM domain-containing protein